MFKFIIVCVEEADSDYVIIGGAMEREEAERECETYRASGAFYEVHVYVME